MRPFQVVLAIALLLFSQAAQAMLVICVESGGSRTVMELVPDECCAQLDSSNGLQRSAGEPVSLTTATDSCEDCRDLPLPDRSATLQSVCLEVSYPTAEPQPTVESDGWNDVACTVDDLKSSRLNWLTSRAVAPSFWRTHSAATLRC